MGPQLALFIGFLTRTGLWESSKSECPLFHSSPNAPEIGDVLGTWLSSIPSDHGKLAHVTALRCDGVNPDLPSINRIISEDAPRRALVQNWWSLYVRLANPRARREAITSRSWSMTSVGRRTEHAGHTTITLTAMYAEFGKACDALIRVSCLLQGWAQEAAEKLNR